MNQIRCFEWPKEEVNISKSITYIKKYIYLTYKRATQEAVMPKPQIKYNESIAKGILGTFLFNHYINPLEQSTSNLNTKLKYTHH